jgi:hypothetical protein
MDEERRRQPAIDLLRQKRRPATYRAPLARAMERVSPGALVAALGRAPPRMARA